MEFDITQIMGINPKAAGAPHYINLPALAFSRVEKSETVLWFYFY